MNNLHYMPHNAGVRQQLTWPISGSCSFSKVTMSNAVYVYCLVEERHIPKCFSLRARAGECSADC